jgi:hypothetical protein
VWVALLSQTPADTNERSITLGSWKITYPTFFFPLDLFDSGSPLKPLGVEISENSEPIHLGSAQWHQETILHSFQVTTL